jgi:D-alanyl-D-alanine carboxypeptidase (penicillin-binding protein 5/6)
MKKLLFRLFCLMLTVFLLPLTVFAAPYENEEGLASPHIAVYNTVKDVFVYTKGAEDEILPASTAKIMTGILALEYFEGRLDTKVTVTTAALRGLEGSAVLNLKSGEEISVRDLLYAMLVAGMNDAANVLAIETAGSILNFVSLMNKKAKEIGAEHTLYLNPTGFDTAAAYTTAADTARIAAYAYRNKTFMEMCSARAYTVSATNMHDAVTVYTRNSLLTTQGGYYYKYAEGISSGYTETGGYAIVAASSWGAYPYVCVAMGSLKETSGNIGGYTDVKKLLSWAGDNYLERKILDKSKIVAELPVLAGKSDHVLIVPGSAVYSFLDVDLDLSAVTYSVELDYDSLKAPVKKDAIVGSIMIVLDGEPIGSTHLVTKTAIRKSAGGAFLLGLKTVLTHPVFIIIVILALFAAAFYIYKTFFAKKPSLRKKLSDAGAHKNSKN